jgi:hypothetical protein
MRRIHAEGEKGKPFRKKYRPVVVYFEALEDIFYTMKAACESVEVSSEDYKFETIEDARKHFGGRPQVAFTISGWKPYATVEFSRLEASLYVSAGDKSAQLYSGPRFSHFEPTALSWFSA